MLPTILRLPLPHWTIPLPVAVFCVALATGAAWTALLWGPQLRQWGARIGVGMLLFSCAGWAWGHGRYLYVDGFDVQSFGALLGAGLLLAWLTARSVGESLGQPRRTTDRISVGVVVGGLLGGRLAFVLAHEAATKGPGALVSAFNLRSGGFDVTGALLGALVALISIAGAGVVRRMWLDIFAPAALVALGVIRVGDYLHGSYFGALLPDGSPRWLAALGRFPRWDDSSGSGPWVHQITSHSIPANAPWSQPVHPIQLYESALVLALAAGTLTMVQRRHRQGSTFLFALIGYIGIRLSIDWLSEDVDAVRLGTAVPAWAWALVQAGLLTTALFLGPAQLFAGVGRVITTIAIALVSSAPFLFRFVSPLPGERQLTTTQLCAAVTLLAVPWAWRHWHTEQRVPLPETPT